MVFYVVVALFVALESVIGFAVWMFFASLPGVAGPWWIGCAFGMLHSLATIAVLRLAASNDWEDAR